MQLFGITWVGLDAVNIRKLVVSGIFILVTFAIVTALRWIIGVVLRRTDHLTRQTRFWTRQAVSLLGTVILLLGLLSIWFNDPARLASALGLASAGLAFALQQPVTSIASYFVILRGNTFTVGDRISMGGVRGDVMQLGFIQTTIMEMGQAGTGSEPGMWVHSRQFTGRIVTVSNSRIFSEPVYNYTREFPFIWEEMAIPITYAADRAKAEAILLAAAEAHAASGDDLLDERKDYLEATYGVDPIDLAPRVFHRITDNWLELTVRFVAKPHGIRSIKDAMARTILAEFDKAGIGIASATYDIVGLPPVELREGAARRRKPG